MKGSEGFGGRRYQIVAVLLTYAAISMAFIVVVISNVHGSIDYAKEAPNLILLGLASPFLELQASTGNGLIGLVILFIGLQIAWRIAAGGPHVTVEGPY